jgi:NAD(P)H-hydrate epimerase
LSCDGGAVIIDADGINALSLNPKRATEILQASKRKVILTPHPLELSRIAELPTESIQADRLGTARAFASFRKVILVLKGAGTITTDGKRVFINSSGSSALAKAGSGDVLAGLISGIAASGTEPLVASALATYLHGLAADRLADELSELGVTPSDLPIRIAREMAELSKNKNKK